MKQEVSGFNQVTTRMSKLTLTMLKSIYLSIRTQKISAKVPKELKDFLNSLLFTLKYKILTKDIILMTNVLCFLAAANRHTSQSRFISQMQSLKTHRKFSEQTRTLETKLTDESTPQSHPCEGVEDEKGTFSGFSKHLRTMAGEIAG